MLRLFSKNVTITKARSFLCFTDDFYKGFFSLEGATTF